MLIGDRREVWLGRGEEKRDREQECKGNKEKEKSKWGKLTYLDPLWQGFSVLAQLAFWARWSFVVSSCQIHCRMFNSILCLYPLDARSTNCPQLWQPKTIPDIAECLRGGKLTLSWDPLFCDIVPQWYPWRILPPFFTAWKECKTSPEEEAEIVSKMLEHSL